MNKLVKFSIPFKAFGAIIFSGLIILYMVTVFIYKNVTGVELDYNIPFILVIQGIGLSVLISLLWSLFFSNVIIKKWRFFIRHILFELSMLVLVAISILTFLAIPTNLTKLWLIAVVAVSVFVIILFGICEMYYKKTGKRYTEILKAYQETIK